MLNVRHAVSQPPERYLLVGGRNNEGRFLGLMQGNAMFTFCDHP
jgi:hypothetical protein